MIFSKFFIFRNYICSVDVVVAGVGVAGAFTLKALSKSLNVVGIDKRETLGYPVECGEIIPTKKEIKRLLPDLDDYSIFDIPKKYESNRTKEIHFVLPNGKTYEVDFSMHVVRRDEMIQDVAKSSKHKLLLKTRVVDCDAGLSKLKTTSGTLDFKVLVACDGANSKIAKKMGVWRYELSPAKQYLMKNVDCDEDVIYMYIGKKIAAGGYAWIIPKGNGLANVGIGFRKEYAEKGDNIHKALDRFVKQYEYSRSFLKDAEIVEKIGAVVPVDLPLDKTVYNNVLFVGDAASMIISHVGAGIPTSMVAGTIAGEVINEFFEGKTSLEDYENRWRDRMFDVMKNAHFIKRLWDEISLEEDKLVKYFKLINNRDMGLILRSKVPLKLKLAKFFLPLLKIL